MPSGLAASSSVANAVLEFTERIIHATSPFVSAFKFNIAFFEALGVDGFRVLKEALSCTLAGITTIADAKPCDIGNTARFYDQPFFANFNFDAIPYMLPNPVISPEVIPAPPIPTVVNRSPQETSNELHRRAAALALISN